MQKDPTMAQTEHKHGEMNTTDHEKTFAGFVSVATKVAMVSIGVLIFLAIFNT